MKRGSPLARYSQLATYSRLEHGGPLRRSHMKRQPPRRIAERAHMRGHLAAVAALPCAGELGIESTGRGWREHYCFGPIQVAHLGVKPGLGLKCPDDETGPLCMGLHSDFDQHRGAFMGWTREERRSWADEVIRRTRAAIA